MPDLPRTNYLCPITIGRTAEFDALRAFLTQDSGVLLISGEAGIGKSRLVHEARSIAAAAGMQSLTGRSFEADRSLPYATAIDLLQSLVERLGAAEVARLAGSAAPDLARLLPELLPQAQAASAPPDAESAKRRLLEGFSRLMIELSKRQPLLLIIEDIHWPDASSLELLLHLARRVSRGRLHLLLTYRSDEVQSDLSRVLATFDRERLAIELSLDRLDALQVAAMLQAIFAVPFAVPAALLHTLFSLTDGNPFFIEETLTALGAQHQLVTADGRWNQMLIDQPRIPRSVNDAVRQRFDALSDAARQVLLLAAVAGRRFDFDLLGMLSALPESALLALIKELINAQLVVEEREDRFVFRHALTREAIRASLLDRERRQLHRRVADAIVALSDGLAEYRLDDLSEHYYAARAWPQALEVARLAGARAAALHAPGAAIAHYSRAIESARALSLPSDGALHLARGRVYETIGDFDHAREDYEFAVNQARSHGIPAAEWQALLELSLLWSSRDYRQTGEYAEQALRVATQLDDPSRIARTLNRIGNWLLNREEPQQAVEKHQQALPILEALDEPRLVAETLDLLGIASLLAGHPAEGFQWYTRATSAWRDLEEQQGLAGSLIGITLSAHNFHAATVAPAIPVAAVHELGEESLLLSRRIGWRAGEVWALWAFRGMTLGAAGRYDVALPATRKSLMIALEIGHLQWQAAARCVLANLYSDLGDHAAALQEIEAALTLARQTESPYWTRSAAAWLVSVLTRAGQMPRAAKVLATALQDGTPRNTIAGRALWYASAELALAQDKPLQAIEEIDRLVAALHGERERPIALLELLRARALMRLHQLDSAEAALLRAHEAASWALAQPLLWRSEAALGDLYRQRSQQTEATRAFDSARAIVEELAASVPDDGLRASLVSTAARWLPPTSRSAPSRRRTPGDAPLTHREQQVASLLREGLTNREIGERLFLSEWTAATHVRNILAKLGLSSRAQIAAWAATQDLPPNS